ncbi:hypothetical protein KXV95_006887 [Aspergillus fumigatus]|nr:hypothetical protein KXV95_006887 [Aspergillus fumigatus]
MEEAIQILTAQKIRELLTLCGIGDRSDEPIKQHILGISNFEDKPATELRGSYQALSFAKRCGRVDYAGLDGPARKKRKRGKKSSNATKIPNESSSQKHSDAASPGQTEQANTCAGVATDKSLVPGEPKVGGTAPAPHGQEYPTSNSSALPEVEAERHSALDSPSSATEGVPRPDHQKEPDCPSLAATHICSGSTFDVNGAGCNTLLPSRLSSMPTLRQKKDVTITTKIEDIRGYVEEITQLKYADAMHIVKKDNALFASKAMQARYNETAYWDIILKGAKVLDPSKLPTAMGRLDDFTRAEKHAMRTFMEEAGYGTSYANQQRCRRLWRNLSQMRNAGVDRILLYRTKEFDSFCHEYPKDTEPSLLEMI